MSLVPAHIMDSSPFVRSLGLLCRYYSGGNGGKEVIFEIIASRFRNGWLRGCKESRGELLVFWVEKYENSKKEKKNMGRWM